MVLFTSKRFQNLILGCYVLSLIALIVLRDIFDVDVNKFVFLIFAIPFIFLFTLDSLIVAFSFTLPILNGLPSTYFLLVFAVFYLIKSGTRSLNLKTVIIYLIFVFMEAAHMAVLSKTDYAEYFKYFMALFLFFVLIGGKTDVNVKKALYFYMLGLTVFCVIIVVSNILKAPDDWLELMSTGSYRFGKSIDEDIDMHIRANANELAFFAVSGIAVGLYIIGSRSGEKEPKLFVFLMTIIIFAAGALSLSRSYVIVVTLTGVLFVLMQCRSIKSLILTVLILIALAFAAIEVLKQYNTVWEGFVNRFTRSDLMTGNNRTVEFQDYHDIFILNVWYMIFGTGVIGYIETTGMYQSIHNMMQQIFVCYGIPLGFAFSFITFKPLFVNMKRNMNVKAYLPAFAVLLFAQTIQFVNPSYLMLHYVMAVFVLNAEFVEKNRFAPANR